MEPFVLAVVIAGAALIAIADRRRKRVEVESWRSIARFLGLGYQPASGPRSETLSGTFDGFDLKVGVAREGSLDWTVVSVSGGGLPHDLTIGRAGTWTRAPKPSDRQFVTGDEVFDEAIEVRGPAAAMAAALDAGARRAIDRMVYELGGTVEEGVLRIRSPGRAEVAKDVDTLLRFATALARRLTLPEPEIPERLAAIAESDDLEAVRVRCFTLLVEHDGKSELTTGTARRLLADAHPSPLRLRAARHLGDTGVLRALLDDADPGVVVGAAESLVASGERDAQAKLLALLRDENLDVQVLAAQALGRAGDVSSVEALLACVEAAPLIGAGDLKDAGKQAIAAIQARLGDADQGRLSLAAGDGGALSVAPSEGGELSDPSPTD